MRTWTQQYLEWIKRQVAFTQPAQQATLQDYLNEVEHCTLRIGRLDTAIEEAVRQAPPNMREVVEALQALRGVAKLTAVTVVAEVGTLSRFRSPRQLMGYSGTVSSEYSSGQKTQRGAITKTGNAHLRRVIVEAAWTQRHRPILSRTMRERQKNVSAEVQEIATKARHRLHARYVRLLGRGKSGPQAVTAVARELLGFIWAIGVTVEQAQSERARGAA
jgi:transposase